MSFSGGSLPSFLVSQGRKKKGKRGSNWPPLLLSSSARNRSTVKDPLLLFLLLLLLRASLRSGSACVCVCLASDPDLFLLRNKLFRRKSLFFLRVKKNPSLFLLLLLSHTALTSPTKKSEGGGRHCFFLLLRPTTLSLFPFGRSERDCPQLSLSLFRQPNSDGSGERKSQKKRRRRRRRRKRPPSLFSAVERKRKRDLFTQRFSTFSDPRPISRPQRTSSREPLFFFYDPLAPLSKRLRDPPFWIRDPWVKNPLRLPILCFLCCGCGGCGGGGEGGKEKERKKLRAKKNLSFCHLRHADLRTTGEASQHPPSLI